MRRYPRILLLLFSLLSGPATAIVTGPERLDHFLADVITLSAEFEQTLFDENFKPIDNAKGRLLLNRPGKFRWDYHEPTSQLIVSDGQQVWFYDRELEQVTVRNMDEAIGSTPAVLLTSNRPLTESFVILDLGSQGTLAWVGLKPIAEDSGFTDIRLGFDESQLVMLEFVDGFGQITQIKLSNFQLNPVLDASEFRFEPPSGTDILRDRQ